MSATTSELERIDAAIRTAVPECIRGAREFLRLPQFGPESVRAARDLGRRLTALGCEQLSEFQTKGYPILYAELPAGARETLIVYLMYDTAPVLDGSEWSTPPFAAEIADLPAGRAIVARGALARRAPAIAFLGAVQAIKDAGVRLPVNMLFVAEGDENIGSPYLPEFYDAYRTRLERAAATFFPAASQEAEGSVAIRLGAKGMLGLELVCDAAAWGRGPTTKDLHWGESGWVDSPMWRLAHAVSTLAGPDGSRVAIDGFYDTVVPPREDEIEMVRALPFDGAKARRQLGVGRFSAGANGLDAMLRNLYEPSIVLEGVWGSVPPITRLYRKAVARIDFRLIRNQTADDIEAKVRAHLATRGFADIAVTKLFAVPCSSIPRDDAVIEAAVRMYGEFGVTPEMWPSYPKTPPTSVFDRPYVSAGLGHGGNQAARNEYLLVESKGKLQGFETLERSFVRFLFEYAALRAGRART